MNKSKGFTLIELLIVIVLIGILAAVLITIIDPGKQQNSANDGTVQAMVNKVILTAESFNSAYGRVPNEDQFFKSLDFSATEAFGNACTVAGVAEYECLFSIQGINLPQACDSSGWTDVTGSGTDQCYFRYKGNINSDPGRFRLYVKSVGIATALFTFDSKSGGEVFECPLSVTDSDPLVGLCQ